jgi:hypothetical protein
MGDKDQKGSASTEVFCLDCSVACTTMNERQDCPKTTPRARSPSVFADLGAIGDRAREIREKEKVR